MKTSSLAAFSGTWLHIADWVLSAASEILTLLGLNLLTPALIEILWHLFAVFFWSANPHE